MAITILALICISSFFVFKNVLRVSRPPFSASGRELVFPFPFFHSPSSWWRGTHRRRNPPRRPRRPRRRPRRRRRDHARHYSAKRQIPRPHARPRAARRGGNSI